MSKKLLNEQMQGFRDIPLEFADEDDQATPLTVRKLFLLACNTYEGESMKVHSPIMSEQLDRLSTVTK